MTLLEAVILGLVQGLTEFLPVSSSGHLELGSVLLGLESSNNLLFSIMVHAATALSTIFIFRKDIINLVLGLLKFRWNYETQFSIKILISMIPVGVIGILYENEITALFEGRVMLVGMMLIVTASLLAFSSYIKNQTQQVGYFSSFLIGIAQAIAIMPGISRSGATIGVALLLKIRREEATRFSFLMVLIPIVGASMIKLKDYLTGAQSTEFISQGSLLAGFVAAFISGIIACRWMVKIVKEGKLIYFALYCFIIGSLAIISQFL